MKRCAAAVLLAACLAACRPKESPSSAAANPYEEKLQPLIEEFLRKQEIPGLAIAIVDDGKVVYEHGFGIQSLKAKDPSRRGPSSTWPRLRNPSSRRPSCSSSRRAAWISTRPSRRTCPTSRWRIPRAGTITIRQLLTHTSGMPDEDDYEWDKPQYDDGALERYVRSLKDQKLIFAPGERFQYSNIAYEILGDAVAKASGITFEEHVHRNILQPLGMSKSTLLVTEADPALMTWGHELDGRGRPFVSTVYPYNRMHTPSSDLHSNVQDMARWAIANLDASAASSTASASSRPTPARRCGRPRVRSPRRAPTCAARPSA